MFFSLKILIRQSFRSLVNLFQHRLDLVLVDAGKSHAQAVFAQGNQAYAVLRKKFLAHGLRIHLAEEGHEIAGIEGQGTQHGMIGPGLDEVLYQPVTAVKYLLVGLLFAGVLGSSIALSIRYWLLVLAQEIDDRSAPVSFFTSAS